MRSSPFQAQSQKLGKRVAFLGVNSQDNDGDAREFLSEFPVTYPSYRDGELKIAAEFNAVQAFPTTAFYDEEGEAGLCAPGRLCHPAEAGRRHQPLRAVIRLTSWFSASVALSLSI